MPTATFHNLVDRLPRRMDHIITVKGGLNVERSVQNAHNSVIVMYIIYNLQAEDLESQKTGKY